MIEQALGKVAYKSPLGMQGPVQGQKINAYATGAVGPGLCKAKNKWVFLVGNFTANRPFTICIKLNEMTP